MGSFISSIHGLHVCSLQLNWTVEITPSLYTVEFSAQCILRCNACNFNLHPAVQEILLKLSKVMQVWVYMDIRVAIQLCQ